MTIREPAIFRAHHNPAAGDCAWDVYGVAESIYAGGASLQEARLDAKEAFACHFDVDPSNIDLIEFHEHLVYTDPTTSTEVWVRTYECGDADRFSRRRNIRDVIREHLRDNPADFRTFDAGGASTGDIIVTVALPDDRLDTVTEQVGSTDRLYVAMANGEALFWQCLVTADAEGFNAASRPVSSLGLPDNATVADFMLASGASGTAPQDFLLQAA